MAKRDTPRETDPELDAFARQLSTLQPCPPAIDREVLLYRAGQEAAVVKLRRWRWRAQCWQIVAAALALLAGGVSWNAWQARPPMPQTLRPHVAPSIVQDSSAAHDFVAPQPQRNRDHYLRQRYVALTSGLDGLDTPSVSGRIDGFDNRRYRDLKSQPLEF